MAFGQQSGPPASSKQVQELLALLLDAGHDDFRDARGPMGFTQRQAAGKFTRDEADEFIAQLQAADSESDSDGSGSGTDSAGADGGDSGGTGRAAPSRPAPARTSATEKALRKASAQQLAAELQSRGWVVMEP